MEITHLGSGSRGNATLLQTDEAKVLIDCGFSGRQMERRLGQIGVDPKSVDAIVLSHHHTDHGQGAEIFHKRHGAKRSPTSQLAPILDSTRQPVSNF